MSLSNITFQHERNTALLGFLALCVAAGMLVAPTYAAADTARKSIFKAAAKRVLPKPAVRATTKTHSRDALKQQLRQLDSKALSRIETRYGSFIDSSRMARAKASETAFLSHSRYQQQLKRSYPHMSQEQSRYVTGNFVGGKTYVDRNQVLVPRVVAHERLHQLAHPGFRLRTGSRLDEGMTEFLASRIYPDLRIQNMATAYPQHRRIVEMMASRVGERSLARAYFGGNVVRLQAQLDGQLGRGSFRKIVTALERNRHGEAARILQVTR